jgi:hypothetical protein
MEDKYSESEMLAMMFAGIMSANEGIVKGEVPSFKMRSGFVEGAAVYLSL